MRNWKLSILSLLVALASLSAQDREEPADVTRMREQVPELMRSLEKIRGLEFREDVPVHYQTDEEFRAFMRASIDEEYPAERAEADVRLLSAVGLLPMGYDIREEMINATSSQALAYYDPDQKAFFVLKTDMPWDMVEPMVLHELNHALQDQIFGLAEPMKDLSGADATNEDRALAFRFLVEGEATYTMTLYSLAKQGQSGMVEMALRMQANMGRQQMSMMERAQAMMMGADGKKMLEALDARDALPGYIYHGMLDPYMKGAWFVHNIVEEAGSIEGISQAFEHIPTSTEQVLHPEKALGDDRDEPVGLELPDMSAHLGAGAELLAVNTLGELNMRVIFEELGSDGEKACAGWDGDRIHAYALPEREEVSIVWFSTWDSEADAAEFVSALQKAKAKGPAPLAGASLLQQGKDVLVIGGLVEGVDLASLQEAVLEGVERSELEPTEAWFK